VASRAGRRARLSVLLTLLVAAVAVAGCATAPSSGPPRQAPGGSSQVQAYVQELPAPGPTSKWSPTDVVLGFLHASASYAFDLAAAKQFLTPQLRAHWHPGQEPVAVISGPSSLTQVSYRQGPITGQAPTVDKVQFTGQYLATLSQTGQYQYASGKNSLYVFDLEPTKSGWLIDKLPSPGGVASLLLTQSDFEDVYAPRNLFFFARPSASQTPNVLVPDPVYAPLLSSNSALNTDLATGLVNGLLKGQGGSWLSGATVSAFPRGTRLLRKVTITGKTARVDLGGAAVHAQPITVGEMAGQLLATLSDGEYSPPLASQVELYIDNRPESIIPPIGNPSSVSSGLPALFVSDTGGADSVSELPALPKQGVKPQSKLSPAQIQDATVTAVADSPDPDRPDIAVAVSTGTGCAVQVYPEGQGGAKQSINALPGSTAQCTSLSYDANGNLWATAGSGVWFMQPNKAPVPVTMSALAATLHNGGQILALRMAPDAVRAALLVKTSNGTKTETELLLAAVRLHAGHAALGQPVTVSTEGVTNPLAISWYDTYHLAVLAGNGQIYDVPLLTDVTGQQPGATPPVFFAGPSGTPLTLTTEGTELIVGTNQGELWARSASALAWSLVGSGADPIYPG
jgi:Lipoprotein LpqB beta-propeller domain/Sporulation and spore germination